MCAAASEYSQAQVALCLVSSGSSYRFAFEHSSRASFQTEQSSTTANYRFHSIEFPACSTSAPYPGRFVVVFDLSPFIRNQFVSDALESTHSDSVVRTEFDFTQFYCYVHAPVLSGCFLILILICLSYPGRP